MQTQRATTNELKLRPGRAEDAVELGRICFDAFGAISKAHNFPPDFPSPDVATGLISMILTRSDVYDVVAEENGRTVGSNFLWKGDAVAGVGPITVDTNVQNSSIGRALMTDVLAHADKNGILSVRLVQAAFHNRSLSLYTKLGFDAVEPLSNINGPAVGITIAFIGLMWGERLWVMLLGTAIFVVALYAWLCAPVDEPRPAQIDSDEQSV